ncbi:cystathionine gamma-synthase [Xylariomycetidae sp. FL2044]|nr:cystathionine gamma-synthase [Xylariomycetidae sp. FL2044]
MAFPDPSDTEFGQSIPPYGPHAITTYAHGWKVAIAVRDGDMSVIARMKSMYPRFAPFGVTAAFCQTIGKTLALPEGHMCAPYLSPSVWRSNLLHATSTHRKEHRLVASDFRYHIVDIHGVRFYLTVFPMAKMMGAVFMWQNAGYGISSRLAEYLMPYVDSMTHVGEFAEGSIPPPPTYLPEGEHHGLLKKRIAGLMMRARVQEQGQAVKDDDVFLYQNGMAAIARFLDAVVEMRPGPVVAFGALFHSTYHLFEESAGGIKHYGKADDADVDEFEKYLEGGGKCSFVFTEFPSNPILVSVDLMRLRKLADEYGFLIAADDTCASFCNIDLLPAADAVITSLTKSFSGYADVMAGSVVLNPNMPQYSPLKAAVSSRFHNQLFDGDAAQLWKNSDDYLPRSIILNRNAETLVAYLAKLVEDPAVPVVKVCYPPYSPGSQHLAPFARRPTPEFPRPGYGCLFSVELATLEQAACFYDNLKLWHGPHLGAHLTLAIPFNAITYGKDDPEHHASYGLRPEQIRISVGLEDEELLLRKFEDAIEKLKELGK